MDLDQLPSIDNLHALLLQDIPLLDVRAPTEFAQGAFPHSHNLPLMDDQDRIAIGTCYKQSGQEAAIKLGQKRVSGDIKAHRIAAWADFIKHNPNTVLYCFRGGLRSKITQQWIYETTGKIIPRVEGGYKALRRLLLDSIETSIQKITPIVLSGRTGSGKTRLLYELNAMIDLEGLANHRGSAFGRCVTPQPSTIDFENRLAIQLLKQLAQGRSHLVFEDESRNIGSLHLPAVFFDFLKTAPIILLQIPEKERVHITLQEYVIEMEAAFQTEGHHFADFAAYWRSSLARIKKRLGGQKYQEFDAYLQKILTIHAETGNTQGYEKLIKHLLHDYYDSMYDYQLSKKQDRVIFSGNKVAILAYLKQQGIT